MPSTDRDNKELEKRNPSPKKIITASGKALGLGIKKKGTMSCLCRSAQGTASAYRNMLLGGKGESHRRLYAGLLGKGKWLAI